MELAALALGFLALVGSWRALILVRRLGDALAYWAKVVSSHIEDQTERVHRMNEKLERLEREDSRLHKRIDRAETSMLALDIEIDDLSQGTPRG